MHLDQSYQFSIKLVFVITANNGAVDLSRTNGPHGLQKQVLITNQKIHLFCENWFNKILPKFQISFPRHLVNENEFNEFCVIWLLNILRHVYRSQPGIDHVKRDLLRVNFSKTTAVIRVLVVNRNTDETTTCSEHKVHMWTNFYINCIVSFRLAQFCVLCTLQYGCEGSLESQRRPFYWES